MSKATRTPGLTPVEIPSSDEEPYFVCSSEAEIPLLAQMGAVELHTWGSRMPRPEVADRITFDLDPDPTLPWPRVREAATLVRGMLQELGLQALLKTSGGMGLHVVVPLLKGPSLEVAAAFSRRVAEHLARADSGAFFRETRRAQSAGTHLRRLAAQPVCRDHGRAPIRRVTGRACRCRCRSTGTSSAARTYVVRISTCATCRGARCRTWRRVGRAATDTPVA